MKPRKSPRDWRRLVLRDPNITDATRVLLLVLVEHMRSTDLQVSVPRKDLARLLNRSEKRIQERIKNAHDHGLLSTIRGGYRGHTAVYVAQFGKAERGTDSRPLLESEIRPPLLSDSSDMPGECETPGGPTSSNERPTGTSLPTRPVRVDHLRDEGIEEERWTA